MFLLDTNVISELRKVQSGRADLRVAQWTNGVDAADLFLSAISIYELEKGILLTERKDPPQGAVFRAWLDGQVLPAFDGRIFPVDTTVAQRGAQLSVPEPRPLHDGLIAATALVHGMTVVTRNVADFAPTGVRLLNPWDT
jgi:predicted nucleic acid-binding protein